MARLDTHYLRRIDYVLGPCPYHPEVDLTSNQPTCRKCRWGRDLREKGMVLAPKYVQLQAPLLLEPPPGYDEEIDK